MQQASVGKITLQSTEHILLIMHGNKGAGAEQIRCKSKSGVRSCQPAERQLHKEEVQALRHQFKQAIRISNRQKCIHWKNDGVRIFLF